MRPEPPAPPSARPVPPGSTVRTAERPGPLVARPGLPEPVGPHPSARARPGRFRGFVLRYGWRAYAVPLLAIATIVVLTDLALTTPGVPTGSTGRLRRRACPRPPPRRPSNPPRPRPRRATWRRPRRRPPWAWRPTWSRGQAA
ncbi:hypothetical protein [Blastococcus brunescens]|uniref:Uncharacterized protein n=1 Tax=Blastococcus brunescens TaxID=1564165 RepID=A0ABZ1B1B5_9ACTN|nr:hypothetical protein [Blastococcus sp. BMG 8361]WRL62815.1 hypothetical protein U6N30_23440 [Blastococcus sp. BMG 8361]